MTCRPNPGAGGGCYLFLRSSCVRQGRVTLPCKSLRGVRAPNSEGDVIKVSDHQTPRDFEIEG